MHHIDVLEGIIHKKVRQLILFEVMNDQFEQTHVNASLSTL